MLTTKLTTAFGLKYPVISAPMAVASTANLACAVSDAGGLGCIGGGFGDLDWIRSQFSQCNVSHLGCGLITWALDEKPEVLDVVLDANPKAVFLSFGNPDKYTQKVKDRGITLICQIQTLKDAKHALDCGADVLVAQGAEAGGHGQERSTFTLVPEVADLIIRSGSNSLLCAAGGIADGRGLAATLMLGADGVVVGSRFWACQEAAVHQNMLHAATQATGDDTIRSCVMDIARQLGWPRRYTARVLKNQFIKRWHGKEESLAQVWQEESPKWKEAWQAGDVEKSNTFVGESVGLINSIETAESVMQNMVTQARSLLQKTWA